MVEPDESVIRPFRFEGPRQLRIYERLSLVGPGPAAFYRDACRLVANPMFEATTHLVAHLLRDIESALRDVLEPLVDRATLKAEKASNEDDKHRVELRVILRELQIPETDPLAQAWLGLTGMKNEQGLHAWAHRHALAPPRPVDEDFHRFWRKTQYILDVILGKLETQFLGYIPLLDGFLAKSAPMKRDVETLRKHIPNNLVTLRYFFEKLDFPGWLRPLREAGFFDHPPEPVRDEEEGTIGYPFWPQGRYLVRMAGVAPDEVAKVIQKIPKTDNSRIYEDLASASLAMPPEIAVTLVPVAETWLDVPNAWLLPEEMGRLVAHLARGGQVAAALDLAKALLVVLPDLQTDNTATNDLSSRLEPHPRGLVPPKRTHC